MEPDGGIYDRQYGDFAERRDQGKGYNFQHAPSGNAAPPVVSFAGKLRWWSLDRWRRMRKIREERDHRVQEIVQLERKDSPAGASER